MKEKANMLNFKLYGKSKADIVIEMGLGACMAEWEPFAESICKEHGVLLYERAGIGLSAPCETARTPENIVDELHMLLSEIEHEEQIILIGHSQGGLYAHRYACRYPAEIKKLILVDPLSNLDYQFKEQLSKKEYKKSGVNKTASLRMIQILLNFGLSKAVKRQMRNAIPFYYYKNYTDRQTEAILDCF